jgi:hypothetical protein
MADNLVELKDFATVGRMAETKARARAGPRELWKVDPMVSRMVAQWAVQRAPV